jgi:hypothetical protein
MRSQRLARASLDHPSRARRACGCSDGVQREAEKQKKKHVRQQSEAKQQKRARRSKTDGQTDKPVMLTGMPVDRPGPIQ